MADIEAAPPKHQRRLVGQSLLYAISVFASLGVFLFGYDQGVMSGIITQPYFLSYFHLTPLQLGTMVAVLEIGAFVTSLAAGQLGDIIGRRGTLFIGAHLTNGFASMVVGRVVSGFGVGLLSCIVPIYQSEVSPPNHRGALAAMEFTGNIIGYSSSVWIDYFASFIDSDLSWRVPLLMQCVIGAILAVGSLLMPESPRWLIDVGREAEGLRVIADLHGGDPESPEAVAEFEEIQGTIEEFKASGAARSYYQMWRQYKRRVLLAMSSQAFAQLVSPCGCDSISVISYYAPRVFEEAGWVGRDAILMTGINSLVYIASTIPPWILVDRWGRRPILLSGAVVMCISLVTCGYWMFIDVAQTASAVVVCVIVYNAAFGYSWGPIPWLYPPEIMPLVVRAKGFNFLVGEITPVLQETIEWRLYPMHGFFCACSFVLEERLEREENEEYEDDDDDDVEAAPPQRTERTSLLAQRTNSYRASYAATHGHSQ
ncbi:hypothetical protein DL96DRAFT_1666119 [Flagelloscypha sp. PMI_526]|nr:hypothetical protein DL96DRAFT_1666119 [Flagelloscypha sp. PMI_526]